ncbi:metal-dependent hydrolase [Aurantivibrio plasticivorans]
MDPVTQGALGAAFAQLKGPNAKLSIAALLGAASGMAADLDVLIRSSTDPLLALQFHRHFTHSLLFIPFAALICASVFYWSLGRRWGLQFRAVLIWSALGYSTHALLDGCTSYGTQLFWPLSNTRYSWDIISVVDPLFTLPLLVGVLISIKTAKRFALIISLVWCGFYLGLGAVQHHRAVTIGEGIALQRGHEPARVEAKPSFGNLVVWKTVYEHGDRFYIDAVKPGFSSPSIWPGDSIEKLKAEDFAWLGADSQQQKDIARFDWFSAGFTALSPEDPHQIVDVRYSMLPQDIDPLWGIRIKPDAHQDEHVEYFTSRGDSDTALRKLLSMIFE